MEINLINPSADRDHLSIPPPPAPSTLTTHNQYYCPTNTDTHKGTAIRIIPAIIAKQLQETTTACSINLPDLENN